MKHNLFIYTFCLFMIGFLGSTNLLAQPQIEWQKSLGGSNDEYAYSIQQTIEGGYIIAGDSRSKDGDVTSHKDWSDYWIVKIDATGMIQWQKSLGGSFDDEAHAIQQTCDGGYIVAGFSDSDDGDIKENHGGEDYWIIKLDNLGVIEWQKCLGGSDDDEALVIQQTKDEGYIIAGKSFSNDGNVTNNHGEEDYWIVKLNVLGAIEWEKSLGGSGNDKALAIQQTADNGYIVAGGSNSTDGDVTGNHGDTDYWIVKLNEVGEIQWEKSLGGSDFEIVHSIQQCKDYGYIIAGRSASNNGDITENHGNTDYWIVKLAETGEIEWQKSFGGSHSELPNAIRQDKEGSYWVVGWSESEDGDLIENKTYSGCWILKLNQVGEIQWQYFSEGNGENIPLSIQQTTDNGYIIAGRSSSDNKNFTDNHGFSDYWIVKLSSTTAIETPTLQNLTISPNPTTGELYINLENLPNTETLHVSITNLLGQTVLQQEMIAPTCTLDIATQPAGVYFLHIKQANGVEMVRKVEKL